MLNFEDLKLLEWLFKEGFPLFRHNYKKSEDVLQGVQKILVVCYNVQIKTEIFHFDAKCALFLWLWDC